MWTGIPAWLSWSLSLTIAAVTPACASAPGAPLDASPLAAPSGAETSLHAPVPPGAASDDREVVTLFGRIDPVDVRTFAGSTVEVFRLLPGGELEELSLEDTLSDASGRYRAQVRLPRDPVDLLIVSTHEGATGFGAVLVPSWSSVDGVIVAPPISQETRVEVDVFLAAVAAGIWPETLGATELKKAVSQRLAARLFASSEYHRDILVVAHAAVASIESWYRVVLGSSGEGRRGLDPVALAAVLEALGWAQVALEAQLYASDGAGDDAEARDQYDLSVRACWAGVEVGPDRLALAAQAAADAFREPAFMMSDHARSTLVSEAEALRAHFVRSAVEAMLVEAGVPEEEREAVIAAGSRLEGRILSAPAAARDVEPLLESAWTEYRSAVQARLRSISDKGEREVI